MPGRMSVTTHNPFTFAHGEDTRPPRVEARFEIRLRVEKQLRKLDERLGLAIRQSNSRLAFELTEERNQLVRQLP